MEGLLKNLLKAGVGLAIMLAWWTLRGPGEEPGEENAAQIPAMVWEGGGGTLTIRVTTSSQSRLHLTFSEADPSDRSLEVWEPVPAGSHEWSIDVPSDVSGYVDFNADQPNVGDSLAWTVEVNGAVVDEQSQTLDKPLQPGWGFGIQTYFDDYASGTLGEG
jgi:hypothetical protein